MAEKSSFLGVIERLKEEGLLDRNSGTNSIKSLKQINQDGFNTLSLQMGELIDFFKNNALQNEENRRELLKALEDDEEEPKIISETEETSSLLKGLGGFTLAGFILKQIGEFINGIFVGLVQGYGKFFKIAAFIPKKLLLDLPRFLFGKLIAQLRKFPRFRLLEVKLLAARKGVTNFFSIILQALKGLRDSIKGGLVKAITSVTKVFGGVAFLFTGTGLKELKGLGTNIKKGFLSLKNAATGFIRGIPFVGTFFDSFLKLRTGFGRVVPLLRNIAFGAGRVFGRFIPGLNLVLGVIDAVTGAFKGFQRYAGQGFFARSVGIITGAISGLVEGFVGNLLNLVKDAFSFILRIFKLDEAADALDSLDFKKLFNTFFFSIADRIVEDFKNLSLGQALTNMSVELVAGLAKSLKFVFADIPATLSQILAVFISTMLDKFTSFIGEDSLFGKTSNFISKGFKFLSGGAEDLSGVIDNRKRESDAIDNFAKKFKFDNTNNSGAQLEVGQSNVSDSKASQQAQIFLSGSSSPQSTSVNNSSVTLINTNHGEYNPLSAAAGSY